MKCRLRYINGKIDIVQQLSIYEKRIYNNNITTMIHKDEIQRLNMSSENSLYAIRKQIQQRKRENFDESLLQLIQKSTQFFRERPVLKR